MSRPCLFRPAAVALLACLAFTRPAAADESGEPVAAKAPLHFTNAQDRFSLSLPAGWKEMPAEMAEGLADTVKAAKAGGMGAYGFELANHADSLTPPYVTVQVMRSGRIADGFVRLLNNPEIRRRAVIDLIKNDGLDERDLVSVSFQTNQSRLRFSATHRDENGTQVELWHDLTFTEYGSINVTCLTDLGDSTRWRPIFGEIMDSLTVHSRFAYQPKEKELNSSNLAGAKFRATKVLVIPGLMVILGLARLISQRFSDRVMSDEI